MHFLNFEIFRIQLKKRVRLNSEPPSLDAFHPPYVTPELKFLSTNSPTFRHITVRGAKRPYFIDLRRQKVFRVRFSVSITVKRFSKFFVTYFPPFIFSRPPLFQRKTLE